MRISDWSSDVCSSDLPAVDVAELGAHFGGRTARIGPYALPEFGVFGRRVMLDRLLGREPGGGDIAKEGPAACCQCQQNHADTKQRDVEPGIIRDPRAHAQPFAVMTVEIELGAAV